MNELFNDPENVISIFRLKICWGSSFAGPKLHTKHDLYRNKSKSILKREKGKQPGIFPVILGVVDPSRRGGRWKEDQGLPAL